MKPRAPPAGDLEAFCLIRVVSEGLCACSSQFCLGWTTAWERGRFRYGKVKCMLVVELDSPVVFSGMRSYGLDLDSNLKELLREALRN